MTGRRPTSAQRAHREAFDIVKQETGWDDDTVWGFIETLPYSEIPDATNALEVLVYLFEHPAEVLAYRLNPSVPS